MDDPEADFYLKMFENADGWPTWVISKRMFENVNNDDDRGLFNCAFGSGELKTFVICVSIKIKLYLNSQQMLLDNGQHFKCYFVDVGHQ